MGHGLAGLLLSTVAGYWVLERAETHKGGLRKVGRLLGAAIILLSALGLICWARGACAAKGAMKGGFCPFSYQSSQPSPPSQ